MSAQEKHVQCTQFIIQCVTASKSRANLFRPKEN